MSVRLRTLGDVQVYADGAEREDVLREARATGLLIYLGSVRRARRDQVLRLLWPEERSDAALTRQLGSLRERLGGDWLAEDRDELRVTERLDLDALGFERAVLEGAPERALDLYGGPFLDGFRIPAASRFDEWALGERRRLQTLHHRAFREWVASSQRSGDPEVSLRTARRWAERYPDAEEPVRHLISLLAAARGREAALEAFGRFRDRLRTRGREPGEEVRRLVEQIRERDPDPPRLRLNVPGGVPATGTSPWSGVRAHGPRLVHIAEEGRGGEVHLLEPGVTRIGRTEGDLTFPDDRLLSSRHASLTLEVEEDEDGERRFRCVLRDEGSRNGVFLRLRADRPLRDGDLFCAGQQVYRFEVERDRGPMKRLD